MSIFSKIIYNGKPTKLEIFGKNKKLAKSLPIHRAALEAGLRLPKIYKVEEKGGKIHKYGEWISGKTIQFEMDMNEDLIDPICMNLGKYVNELYDVDGITAVDSHFENFVWSKHGVIYIDIKKLLYRKTEEEHILQMSKICLKGCRGDRRKVLAFLRGYSEHRDVTLLIDDCNKREWKWLVMSGEFIHTPSIVLEDI